MDKNYGTGQFPGYHFRKSERSTAVINELLNLWERSVLHTHTFLKTDSIDDFRPYVRKALKSVNHLYVAYHRYKSVAFMGIEGENIEMLFVDPNCLRQGIGRNMVDIAIGEHQVQYVEVNKQNKAAHRFYKKMRFIDSEYHNEDAYGNPYPIIGMRQEPFLAITDRLYIRNLSTADYPKLRDFMKDNESMYAIGKGFTDKQIEEWINNQIFSYYKYGYGCWAVTLHEDINSPIGVAGLFKTIIKGRGKVAIGCIFDHEQWHQGYAAEVFSRIIGLAFTMFKIKEINFPVRHDDRQSVRLALKLGMTDAGTINWNYKGKESPFTRYRLKKEDAILDYPE